MVIRTFYLFITFTVTRTTPPHGYMVLTTSGTQPPRQPVPSPLRPPLNTGWHVACLVPAYVHARLPCPLLRNRTFSFFITFSFILLFLIFRTPRSPTLRVRRAACRRAAVRPFFCSSNARKAGAQAQKKVSPRTRCGAFVRKQPKRTPSTAPPA